MAVRQAGALAGVGLSIALLASLVVALTGEANAIQASFQVDPVAPGTHGASVGELAVNNLRLAVVGFGGAFLLKFGDGRYRRVLKPLLDGLLIIVGVGNALLVGAALGGYGPTLVGYALFQLLGFAVAGTAYLEARNNGPTWQRLAAYVPGSVTFLTAAAVVQALGA